MTSNKQLQDLLEQVARGELDTAAARERLIVVSRRLFQIGCNLGALATVFFGILVWAREGSRAFRDGTLPSGRYRARSAALTGIPA